MDEIEKRLRMAIIVGATKAIQYKERNPRASEHEIIQHISRTANEILDGIDDPL